MMEKNFLDPGWMWGKAQRGRCSAIGWALVVYILAGNCAQFILMLLAMNVTPVLYHNAVFMWGCSMVASYGVAFPLFWLLLRGVGAPPMEKRATLTAMDYMQAGTAAYAVLFLANAATLLVLKGLELLLGKGIANPVESMLDYPWGCSLVMMCVLAPVTEELMFRRLILRRLLPWGDRFAVTASALLFALIHGNLSQIPYAFLVGLLLGTVAVYTGSVVPTILIHAFVNLLGSGLLLGLGMDEVVSVVMAAVLIAGIVSLILGKGRFPLRTESRVGRPADGQFPEGEKWRFFLFNPGMIFFFLLAVGLICYYLLL